MRTRSFRGVGPSLSWNGSAALAGNPQDGELTLDWGINAAALFGRQKAKTDHSDTGAYHTASSDMPHDITGLCTAIPRHSHHSTRSRERDRAQCRRVRGPVVPISTNAKLSLGYRYDTFLNAMDTGIDAAKKSNVTFNGPYASISIGLGD